MMEPWGGQISKHCWVNPSGLTRVVFASSLGCCPEVLHWGSFLPRSSKEKALEWQLCSPVDLPGKKLWHWEMRGLWGAAAAPAAPLVLWGGLHEAESKGRSEAASCRSRGRSCPRALPAAPAAERSDRCSSSLESAPSGDEESGQREPQEICHPGSHRRDGALRAHQRRGRGCRGLEVETGCSCGGVHLGGSPTAGVGLGAWASEGQ